VSSTFPSNAHLVPLVVLFKGNPFLEQPMSPGTPELISPIKHEPIRFHGLPSPARKIVAARPRQAARQGRPSGRPPSPRSWTTSSTHVHMSHVFAHVGKFFVLLLFVVFFVFFLFFFFLVVGVGGILPPKCPMCMDGFFLAAHVWKECTCGSSIASTNPNYHSHGAWMTRNWCYLALEAGADGYC